MCYFLLLFCPQCGLALHRKCMEVCQLECDHRKGMVFGVDLSILPRDRPDEVPFVVMYCTSQIERRALSVQVYTTATAKIMKQDSERLSVFLLLCVSLRGCIASVVPSLASKSSVRPLRLKGSKWTFLNTLHMTSPPPLSNSSRRYCGYFQIKNTWWMSDDEVTVVFFTLTQLPEPLLTFDLYNCFIAMGKSIQLLSEREQTPDTNEIMDIIHNLQELLQKLPLYCYSTLQHLVSHLQKWAFGGVIDQRDPSPLKNNNKKC